MPRKRNKKKAILKEFDASIPRSFVLRLGNTSVATAQLVKDFRHIMEPNTAVNLKERKDNRIKDFIMASKELSVSHLVVFRASSKSGINLTITRLPQGPTITFHIEAYTLQKDILMQHSNPKSPGLIFKSAPLVVLNNFEDSQRIITATLQHMFPSIKVAKMKTSEAKRVVLFNMSQETGLIEMRHYRIIVKQLGMSKSVKTLIHSKIPNLNNYQDVGEFIINGAFQSESDVEDCEGEGRIEDHHGGKGRIELEKKAIRLIEIGPRMDLKLVKIEDGLFGGKVLHHAYSKYSVYNSNQK